MRETVTEDELIEQRRQYLAAAELNAAGERRIRTEHRRRILARGALLLGILVGLLAIVRQAIEIRPTLAERRPRMDQSPRPSEPDAAADRTARRPVVPAVQGPDTVVKPIIPVRTQTHVRVRLPLTD